MHMRVARVRVSCLVRHVLKVQEPNFPHVERSFAVASFPGSTAQLFFSRHSKISKLSSLSDGLFYYV